MQHIFFSFGHKATGIQGGLQGGGDHRGGGGQNVLWRRLKETNCAQFFLFMLFWKSGRFGGGNRRTRVPPPRESWKGPGVRAGPRMGEQAMPPLPMLQGNPPPNQINQTPKFKQPLGPNRPTLKSNLNNPWNWGENKGKIQKRSKNRSSQGGRKGPTPCMPTISPQQQYSNCLIFILDWLVELWAGTFSGQYRKHLPYLTVCLKKAFFHVGKNSSGKILYQNFLFGGLTEHETVNFLVGVPRRKKPFLGGLFPHGPNYYYYDKYHYHNILIQNDCKLRNLQPFHNR